MTPVSFVHICPVCKGDHRETCFNCVPSRNPQHPGRGYVLRGYKQPRDYPEFAEIVDVPYGDHWIVLKHRKNYTEMRPEQGTLIDVPKSRKPRPVPANQGVLL